MSVGGLVAGSVSSRTLATDRAGWLFGLSVVVVGRSGSLSLPPLFHRAFSVRVSQKFVVFCRYLSIPSHIARVPSARPSCVTTLAVIYLRLQTRRPQLCPALPAAAAIYSLLESCDSDHL